MVLKELENNPEMQGKDWSQFLPKVTKTLPPQNSLVSKQQKKRAKKAKSFHNKDKLLDLDAVMPQKSKIDLQIETGEYFMDNKEKDKKKMHSKKHKQAEVSKAKKIDKESKYQAPEDVTKPKKKKSKKSAETTTTITADELKNKMK